MTAKHKAFKYPVDADLSIGLKEVADLFVKLSVEAGLMPVVSAVTNEFKIIFIDQIGPDKFLYSDDLKTSILKKLSKVYERNDGHELAFWHQDEKGLFKFYLQVPEDSSGMMDLSIRARWDELHKAQGMAGDPKKT